MRVLPTILAATAACSCVSAFTVKVADQKTFTTSTAISALTSPTDVDGATTSNRRSILKTAASAISTAALLTVSNPQPASARLEAVNRPDLLPTEPGQNVIQIEKFLTSGQVKRMDTMLANLEKDTGFRVRVLCQAYPNTPGLAVREYWDLGKEVRAHVEYYSRR